MVDPGGRCKVAVGLASGRGHGVGAQEGRGLVVTCNGGGGVGRGPAVPGGYVGGRDGSAVGRGLWGGDGVVVTQVAWKVQRQGRRSR